MHSPDKTTPEISSDALIDSLQQIIPLDSVLFEKEDLKPYECDGLSAYRAIPLVVVLPETIEQVKQ
ncbi:MAG: FAD-binding oxidoreductase, partial [Gammaproteobacteria bacterium]|nr:FAD-binding oxidoreductase [Gammaproteobacteria bacterium]